MFILCLESVQGLWNRGLNVTLFTHNKNTSILFKLYSRIFQDNSIKLRYKNVTNSLKFHFHLKEKFFIPRKCLKFELQFSTNMPSQKLLYTLWPNSAGHYSYINFVAKTHGFRFFTISIATTCGPETFSSSKMCKNCDFPIQNQRKIDSKNFKCVIKMALIKKVSIEIYRDSFHCETI